MENGTFRYPDLPLPARDIALDLAITNPGGDADSTTVNLRRFHVVVGKNPVDAVLVVRTPISDPDVDARVAGKVDLGDLRRTMKLEGMQELAGIITADAAVRTRMSWLDSAKPQYDRIAARGTVNVAGVTVKSDSLPHPLSIREASLTIAPKNAELRSFDATIGSSDIRLSGRIDNLLGFALRDEVLRGSATLASKRFDLNEWRSDEGELSVIPVPANLDFGFDATVNELLYDKLTMRDARGRLRVKDQRITLENFTFNTLGGGFAVNGFYDTKDLAKPAFDVGLKIQKLDIPKAFEAFTTVQMLAPVAKYATGTFSTELKLNGLLGKDMMPVFPSLKGAGGVQTSILRLQDFPPLDKVASMTKLSLLENPGLKAVRSQFAIRDGRLQVQPFDVGIGQTSMRVSGSNGIDQSLDYDLNLRVPALAARRRGEPGDLRAGVEGGGRGGQPAGRAGDRPRHQAGRQGDQSVGLDRRGERRGLDGADCGRGGAGGGGAAGEQGRGFGEAEGVGRGGEAGGRRGEAGGVHPGRGQLDGGEGEEGGLPAGRLAGGEERRALCAGSREAGGGPAPQGDRCQGGGHREGGGRARQRAGRRGEEEGGAVAGPRTAPYLGRVPSTSSLVTLSVAKGPCSIWPPSSSLRSGSG